MLVIIAQQSRHRKINRENRKSREENPTSPCKLIRKVAEKI